MGTISFLKVKGKIKQWVEENKKLMAHSLSSSWMLSSKGCSASNDLYGRLDSSCSAVIQQVTLRHHNTVFSTMSGWILAVQTCSVGLVIGQSSPQFQHSHQLLLFWVIIPATLIIRHFLKDGPDFFSFFNNREIHVSSLSCVSSSLDFSCLHWWFNVEDRRIKCDDLCWTVSIYLHVQVCTKQNLN